MPTSASAQTGPAATLSEAAALTAGGGTTAPVLQMKAVEFVWPAGKAVEGFGLAIDEFSITQGSTTLLLGASGSGKSTLLSLIAGIVLPNAGSIVVAGTDITTLSGRARDRHRSEHLGVIFQMFNLLPYASVVDNVVLPLSFAPERRARVSDPARTAECLLDSLGLDRSLHTQPARTLSVGQQQRVAVARALIGEPDLIIADEPTSALDADRRDAFLDLVFAQRAETGAALLMVSHERALASRFDQALELKDIARTSAP